MSDTVSDQATANAAFWSGWKAALPGDSLLSPGLQEAYRRTIEGFAAYCGKKKGAATKELARAYIDLEQLERAPGPAQLQEWKDALNWYFRALKRRSRPLEITGIPPLARADHRHPRELPGSRKLRKFSQLPPFHFPII